MSRHIALLRGVNVGGVKAPMADLKAMLADLGFENPRSYVNSGNLLFDGWTGSTAELETLLEAESAKRGIKTVYFVRTPKEWDALIKANPFPDEARDRPTFLIAMLLREPLAAGVEKKLADAITGPERMKAKGRTLYVDFPDGQGRSKLGPDWNKTKLSPLCTARNWNTVLKLAELARV